MSNHNANVRARNNNDASQITIAPMTAEENQDNDDSFGRTAPEFSLLANDPLAEINGSSQ